MKYFIMLFFADFYAPDCQIGLTVARVRKMPSHMIRHAMDVECDSQVIADRTASLVLRQRAEAEKVGEDMNKSATNSSSQKTTQQAENNQVLPGDKPVHDWFRFVLSFPPHLVREYLDRFNVNRRQRVLDPFCGTGTTVVECKKRGIKSVGLEANPAVSYFAQTKLDWTPNASELVVHSKRIADAVLKSLHAKGMSDNGDLPLFSSESDGQTHLELLRLPDDLEKLLIKDSISAIPLHKALVLLEKIEQTKDSRFYNHQRLAFAKTLIFSASNLHFGPEVGVSRKKKKDAPVVAAWLDNIRRIAEDLGAVQNHAPVESVVYDADARMLSGTLKKQWVNAVITSPPYPNECDITYPPGQPSLNYNIHLRAS